MRPVLNLNSVRKSLGLTILSVSIIAGFAHGQDRGNRQGQNERGDRQPGGRGMGGMNRMPGLTQIVGDEIFRPTYMVRDLNIYTTELGLDRDQQSMVKTLIEDYDAAFRVNVDEIQAELQDSRPDLENDPEVEERREVLRERFQEVRADIEEQIEQMREAGEIDGDDRSATRELWRSRMSDMRTEMQESMSEFMQTNRFKTMYAEGARILSTWLALRDQLDTEFQSNLSVVLTEEQNMILPSANREVRRVNSAGRGRFAGEGTNLVNVLREVGVDETGGDIELATSLSTYMSDLDDAIQARNQLLISQVPTLLNALERSAPKSIERLVREQSAIHQSVRNVQDQYIVMIAMQLPEDKAAAFSQEALRAGYPDIYSPIGAQRAFDAANKLSDVDDNKREAIAALTEQFMVDLAVNNESILELTRVAEPEEFQERTARRLVMLAGESMERDDDSTGDRLNETYRVRYDSGKGYLEQLAMILTEEQYASLPGTDERFTRGRGNNRGWQQGGANYQEMMKQYDKNGDGELDDEERDALRQQMRERFNGGGRGGEGGGGRGGRGGRGGEGGGGRGGRGGVEI